MNGRRNRDIPPDSPLLLPALEEQSRQNALDILGDPIRRQVLHDLDPEEGPVTLSDLADRVANPHVRGASAVAVQSDDANDATATTVTSATERVAIQLHHVHLPKLADYGLVEYDRREKTVSAEMSS